MLHLLSDITDSSAVGSLFSIGSEAIFRVCRGFLIAWEEETGAIDETMFLASRVDDSTNFVAKQYLLAAQVSLRIKYSQKGHI